MKLRLIALLLSAASLLPAQARLVSWSRQQWDGPTLYTWSVMGTGVEAQTPGRGRAPVVRALSVPQGHRLLTVVQGEAWTVKLEGRDRQPVIHRSSDWKAWERVGELPLPEARIRGCFPLRGERFLLHLGLDEFKKEGQASNLAIFRLKEGTFHLEELVDPGLNVYEPMPKGEKEETWAPRFRPAYREAGLDVAAGQLEAVGGHPVVLMPSLGKVAVFSPEHGHLLKVVTLYDAVDEVIKAGKLPLGSFLLARPLPTGLLVAARTEDAVRTARAIFPDSPPKEPVPGEAPTPDPVWAKRQEAFPEVVWATWDLSESSFRPAAPPAGLPGKIRTVEDLPNLEFLVDLQGQPKAAGGPPALAPAPRPAEAPSRPAKAGAP